ncbi:MAG TPA: ATP-binding protein [Anaerolineaceae bacterium]
MLNSLDLFPQFYISFPYDPVNWIGWLFLLGLLIWGIRRWWDLQFDFPWHKWIALAVLTALTFISSQLLVIHVPSGDVFPLPGVPLETAGPVIFVLACLPFVLASGILGKTWAVCMGALVGLFIALSQTHQLFTVLEYTGLALLYSASVLQPYRAWFYRFLRHPVGSALFISICCIPFFILSAFFATPGSIEARLDYSLTQAWLDALLHGAELFGASLVAEIIYLSRISLWQRFSSLFPAPEERSLRLRFFYGMIPMLGLLFLALTAGDWIVAGGTAKQMVHDRLASTAEVVVESIPYFFETGQNLLISLATPDLASSSSSELYGLLEQKIRIVPYFHELAIFNSAGEFVAGYPDKLDRTALTPDEQAGLDFALKGVFSQYYIVPHLPDETTVQVSFISPVQEGPSKQQAVLLGRTDFNTNPFPISSLRAMTSVKDLGGQGAILDENGVFLFNTTPAQVGMEYEGRRPKVTEFFDEIGADGSRSMVYYQPVEGKSWAVVITVPAELIQRLALNIAFPLLIILLIISIGMFVFWAVSLSFISTSLQKLSQEAVLISRGQLDHAMLVRGEDEVGQLSLAFENMRLSLKARMDELNSLLNVSQGIAANLKTEEALAPVLDAALADGASAARVVLVRDVTVDLLSDRLVSIGKGPASDAYQFNDEQVFEYLKQQPMIVIPNTAHIRLLRVPLGCQQPGALFALALQHENYYYGALWVAYDKPHNFTDTEVRFLITLSGQAAIAAANARLYASAEIGRQRLTAVLESSPEPVLVLDEKMRLLLLNPAALQVAGLVRTAEIGRPVKEVVANPDLLELIGQPLEDRLASREITLANNRIYYAIVSPVGVDSKMVGRVCVLQDITHYKELDTMKSDFVATVSHDLRSPLTLMRGYVTMFQMLGELNDQQKVFMKKIVTGVDEMSRLVINLLNLGRIESGVGLQIDRVNAQELVGQVLTQLQPLAAQKNIQMEHTSVTLPPIYFEADRDFVHQAITNLVENAIKYTTSGGKIKVTVQTRQVSIVFIIQDSGIGIAPLDLSHIFEKFYRSGRREAHTQRGSGLGLAIVKSVAERHGGKVWVESQLGKGSVFFLEIPLAPKKA